MKSKNFITKCGYYIYPNIIEIPVMIKKIFKDISLNDYCLIGGSAVVFYVGTEKRIVSPDIDFLVKKSALNKIKSNFVFAINNLGVSYNYNDFAFDFIASENAFDEYCIRTSSIVSFEDIELNIISKDCLMIKKFLSGRDKDLKDLSLLFSKKEKPNLTTMQNFFPEIVEDYQNELLAILFEKQALSNINNTLK